MGECSFFETCLRLSRCRRKVVALANLPDSRAVVKFNASSMPRALPSGVLAKDAAVRSWRHATRAMLVCHGSSRQNERAAGCESRYTDPAMTSNSKATLSVRSQEILARWVVNSERFLRNNVFGRYGAINGRATDAFKSCLFCMTSISGEIASQSAVGTSTICIIHVGNR